MNTFEFSEILFATHTYVYSNKKITIAKGT